MPVFAPLEGAFFSSMNDSPVPTELFTDGGVAGINGLSQVGTFAWVIVDQAGRLLKYAYGLVHPTPDVPVVTNNTSELFALLTGLAALPDGWNGRVYSDSQIALGRTFLRLEQQGRIIHFRKYGMNGVPESYRLSIAPTLARLGVVTPVLIDSLHLNGPKWARRWDADPDATALTLGDGVGQHGNVTKPWNGFCDYLCNKAKRELCAGLTTRPPRRELSKTE